MTVDICFNQNELDNHFKNDISLNDILPDYVFQYSNDISNNFLNDDNNDSKDFFDNLKKIFYDFTSDLLKTFPELADNLDNKLLFILNNNTSENIENKDKMKTCIYELKKFCLNVYPEKFFDILYQNDKIFSQETPLLLLPGIDFKVLWKENISDNTRETIWKYLQLILFTIVSDISDSSSFGDTAKLFEAINQDDFKTKIEETINQMHSCFDISGSKDVSNIDLNDLPDANFINDHVSGMMDGKLGSLAKEIAEETAKDLNIDMENESSVGDVFQNLLKEPNKLMNLVQKVGGKLDEKLKSGELKESELLAEAGEMVNKMKDMPGMSNLQNMFSSMGGMGGMAGMGGGNSKLNVNAMQAHLERNIKLAKQRERMKSKANNSTENDKKGENHDFNEQQLELANKAANEAIEQLLISEGLNEQGIENFIFSTGEKYDKSSINDAPLNKKKKKKRKKKKKD